MTAWLFDAYPVDEGMAVWLIDQEGRPRRTVEPFRATLYAREPRRGVKELWRELRRFATDVDEVEREELMTGRPICVWRIRPKRLLDYFRVARALQPLQDRVELFNADLTLPQMYFFERGLFPLARCARRDDRLATDDSGWDIDYSMPPLKTMLVRMEGARVNPAHGARGRLQVIFDGQTRSLDSESDRQSLKDLRNLMLQFDPDVVLTEWGDAWLIETLLELSKRHSVRLPFNRETDRPIESRPQKSYFSYGRIVYKAGWRMFRGRWHIDSHNTFIVGEAGLEGLYELARMSRIPVQLMARTTTGTAITSMQLACAYRRGILIPWQKRIPEDFKTAEELLVTDKGGLIYSPEPGIHENIGEIDFASMFPAIMVRHNVSPETVNCRCCGDVKVPGIPHWICRRRRGLVPEVLDPIVRKRLEYKRRGTHPERVTALKWILVVCFGYLGYKNARFGRIEAHECVTAISREKLLQAKELAEARGFRLVHAIVDSLYVHRPGATAKDFAELNADIEKETGLPCGFEGVYDWLAFYPSRQRAGWGVPNRFMGRRTDGELKIRGIEVRRHDTCPWVKAMQGEMVRRLQQARSASEYRAAYPDLDEIFERYAADLAAGRVPFSELVISRRLAHAPEDYAVNNATAVAARQLAAHGARLSPGEQIQLVLTDERADAFALLEGRPVQTDVRAYTKLLRRALETLTFRVKQSGQAELFHQLTLPFC